MSSWPIVLVTLVALLVGMLIPVLLQLWVTLREVRSQLRETREQLIPMLEDARFVAQRIRALSAQVEGHEGDLGALIQSAGNLARGLERFRGSAQIASAVAVAVASAVRAFRETQRRAAETYSEPDSSSEAGSAERVGDFSAVAFEDFEEAATGETFEGAAPATGKTVDGAPKDTDKSSTLS